MTKKEQFIFIGHPKGLDLIFLLLRHSLMVFIFVCIISEYPLIGFMLFLIYFYFFCWIVPIKISISQSQIIVRSVLRTKKISTEQLSKLSIRYTTPFTQEGVTFILKDGSKYSCDFGSYKDLIGLLNFPSKKFEIESNEYIKKNFYINDGTYILIEKYP